MLSATQVDVHFITDHRSGRDAAEWRGGPTRPDVNSEKKCGLEEVEGATHKADFELLHFAHIIWYLGVFHRWVR